MSVPEINDTGKNQTLPLIGALAVILGLMYYSYVYPYPNGKPPEFWGFVLFWLREILIVATAALLMFVVLIGWCVRLGKKFFQELKDRQ